MLVWILFMNSRRKPKLHAQALCTALNRGAQVDSRGASQVLDHGGQAVACGSCFSQVLDRGAEGVSRGAVLCASQVLDRGAQAVARGAVPCASQVLDRGAQAGAQTVACGDAAPSHHEKNLIAAPSGCPRRPSLCVAGT